MTRVQDPDAHQTGLTYESLDLNPLARGAAPVGAHSAQPPPHPPTAGTAMMSIPQDFDLTQYIIRVARPFLNSLQEFERDWVMGAIANMVVADGHIATEERVVMDRVFALVHMTHEGDEYVHKVMDAGQVQDMLDLYSLRDQQVETVLKVLIYVAISDHHFHVTEMNFLREVAQYLHYNPDDLESLIMWGQEELLRINALRN